jgi:hypothetical protein
MMPVSSEPLWLMLNSATPTDSRISYFLQYRAASSCAVLPPDDAKTSPSEVAIVNESSEYFFTSARRLSWILWHVSTRSTSGMSAAAGCCFAFLQEIGTGVGTQPVFTGGW